MKPLGTNNAVENGLTTPTSAFGKPISQCGLSTKSLNHTRENVLSANKSAFEPPNSPSKVATKNKFSIALLCQHQRTKQPLGHLHNFGLKTAETEF
ncbi:TPA: hypothetical protein NJ393_004530 [Vibrio parahaemolyticus]|uniref:hypothetical protein n=1 Tax=Vibrio parahaemolyticus TaxID=670 RepID=UPI00236164C8|nr:hypothetical protein [Vibrio parahaemolyticus]HCG7378571.1 hypothetical protein [Vibrio parahaemolyticus]HCG8518916.1 hypothetical protein [Vibrio parahaemolyticus]HCG8602439.1 hypothetical protein [Vibrio parahaemolyticus]